MKSKTERDGWTETERERDEKEKRGQKEMKIHGNGLRREEGRETRERKEGVCVCVVWCKPWVLVDGWI